MAQSKREIGQLAENAALDYLISHGLKLITRNFTCRSGEIDLIMLDNKHLVFVEVRYRQPSRYGTAIESITPYKQEKIKRAAQYYLLRQHLLETQACRFDIIAITQCINGPQFEWLKNAF